MSVTQGVSQLVWSSQGEASRSETPRGSNQQPFGYVNPLSILSHMPPLCVDVIMVMRQSPPAVLTGSSVAPQNQGTPVNKTKSPANQNVSQGKPGSVLVKAQSKVDTAPLHTLKWMPVKSGCQRIW